VVLWTPQCLHTTCVCAQAFQCIWTRMSNHVSLEVGTLAMQVDAAFAEVCAPTLPLTCPHRPPEEVQCGSCTAWASTYDLSAILATAAHCIPRLAALRFTTHYISDAECAAINLMTGKRHRAQQGLEYSCTAMH
jgi:hypothetical protein